MDEELYNLQEVAKKLRVSERSVFRYIHEGKLRATKIGYWRITKDDLRAFLAKNANIREAFTSREFKDYVKTPKAKKK